MKSLKSQQLRSGAARRWSIVLGILLLEILYGCVKTAPSLPRKTEPNTTRVGLLDVRSVDAPPAILYQKPPKGFVDGFFRGTTHGAVLGIHVGQELAKAFVQRGPEVSNECMRTNRRGGCGSIALMAPVVGLLALVGIPPIVTATAGIQGGFTAYTTSEVEEWEKALNDAQEQLKIQTTFREHVFRSLASCCPGHIPGLLGDVPSSVGSSQTSNLQGVDTILETQVLELGLAEASSDALPEPDENSRAINQTMAKATVPLNAIFQKSRSSLYLLVQTRLLRANDMSIIDQRQFGYLSSPRPYMEWSENSASYFRAEILAAYQSLADEIPDKLVKSTWWSHPKEES